MQFDEHLCDILHIFNLHGASRGPSAIAELLVFSARQRTGTSCMQHSQTAGERTLNFTSYINGFQLEAQQ